MPLLLREHIECPAKDKIAHAIKAKPVEKICYLRDPTEGDVIIDTALEVVEKR